MVFFYLALFIWPFVAPGIWAFIIGQVILTIIVFTDEQQYSRDPSFFGWLIGGVVPFLIVFAILSGIYPQIHNPATDERAVVVERMPILSLTSDTAVSGSFVLGSGTISTSPAYMSKRTTHDGGFETFMIQGKTTVYEDAASAEQAHLIVYKQEVRKHRKGLPAWVLYLIREDRVEPWKEQWGSRYNHLHVPKGTVTRVFQI